MRFQIPVYTLEGQTSSSLSVSDDIFKSPLRKDILSRVVLWQLAKRRSGNHKAKGISDISGTTRKPFPQKGLGRARQGSLRSPQFRGGAVIFGPVVRDHGYSLPKKVRRLGLKTALSSRFSEEKLTVIENLSLQHGKTKEILSLFPKKQSVLLVDGPSVCLRLKQAIANVHYINVLPQQGLNVYDILRHDRLILSRDAVMYLEEWLGSVSEEN